MANTTKIEIPSSDAAALGLVLNEVLTNSIKHGFSDGRSGTLRITTQVIDGRAELIVADDGPGLADDIVSMGLGRTLIAAVPAGEGRSPVARGQSRH